MAKAKNVFVCSNCGHETSKWMGQCPGCREWNTFVEEVKMTGAKAKVTSVLSKEISKSKVKKIK